MYYPKNGSLTHCKIGIKMIKNTRPESINLINKRAFSPFCIYKLFKINVMSEKVYIFDTTLRDGDQVSEFIERHAKGEKHPIHERLHKSTII